MDKFKKFYDKDGLVDVASNYMSLEDIIVCVCWIYIDNNSVKRIITLDPWKLNENKLYKWYNQHSSMCPTNNPGDDTIPHHYLVSTAEMNYLEGKTVGEISNNNSHPMLLFKSMYDYYRFVCAISSGSNAD